MDWHARRRSSASELRKLKRPSSRKPSRARRCAGSAALGTGSGSSHRPRPQAGSGSMRNVVRSVKPTEASRPSRASSGRGRSATGIRAIRLISAKTGGRGRHQQWRSPRRQRFDRDEGEGRRRPSTAIESMLRRANVAFRIPSRRQRRAILVRREPPSGGAVTVAAARRARTTSHQERRARPKTCADSIDRPVARRHNQHRESQRQVARLAIGPLHASAQRLGVWRGQSAQASRLRSEMARKAAQRQPVHDNRGGTPPSTPVADRATRRHVERQGRGADGIDPPRRQEADDHQPPVADAADDADRAAMTASTARLPATNNPRRPGRSRPTARSRPISRTRCSTPSLKNNAISNKRGDDDEEAEVDEVLAEVGSAGEAPIAPGAHVDRP